MISFSWQHPGQTDIEYKKYHTAKSYYTTTREQILLYKSYTALNDQEYVALALLFGVLNEHLKTLSGLTLTDHQQAKLNRLKNAPEFLSISNLFHNHRKATSKSKPTFSNNNKGIAMKLTEEHNAYTIDSSHSTDSVEHKALSKQQSPHVSGTTTPQNEERKPTRSLTVRLPSFLKKHPQESNSEYMAYKAAKDAWNKTLDELTNPENVTDIENIATIDEAKRARLAILFEKLKTEQEALSNLAKETYQKDKIRARLETDNFSQLYTYYHTWIELQKLEKSKDSSESLTLSDISISETASKQTIRTEHLHIEIPTQPQASPIISRDISYVSTEDSETEKPESSPINHVDLTPHTPQQTSIDLAPVKSQLASIYFKLFNLNTGINNKFLNNQVHYQALKNAFSPDEILDKLAYITENNLSDAEFKIELNAILPKMLTFINDQNLNNIINTPRLTSDIQQYALVDQFCQLLKALCGVIAAFIYPIACGVKYLKKDTTPVFADGLYHTFFSRTPTSALRFNEIRQEVDHLQTEVSHLGLAQG